MKKPKKNRTKAGSDQAMECWERMIFPMKRALIGAAARFSYQKTGPRKLRQEVSTCEYADVHVMWEMLQKSDREIARCPPISRRRDLDRRRRRWAVFEWMPRNLCSSF